MNNTNEDIQIYGKLVNVSTEGIVADATSIWSDRYNKNVEEIISAPDEEDLTVEHSDLLGIDTLKLANRDNTNGMGYVILRKNKSFTEQVTKENTIYEIRYEFDLNDTTINIPNTSILYFNGGKIKGGTIIFNNTDLKGYPQILSNIGGTLKSRLNVTYFGIDNTGHKDCSDRLKELMFLYEPDSYDSATSYDYRSEIYFPKGTYLITKSINMPRYMTFTGDSNKESVIKCNINNEYVEPADIVERLNDTQNNTAIFYGRSYNSNVNRSYFSIVMKNLSFIGVDNKTNLVKTCSNTWISKCDLNCCTFSYFNFAFWLNIGYWTRVTNCEFINNRTGIYHYTCNSNSYTNNVFSSIDSSLVFAGNGGSGVLIAGNDFSNAEYGCICCGSTMSVSIIGNYFEPSCPPEYPTKDGYSIRISKDYTGNAPCLSKCVIIGNVNLQGLGNGGKSKNCCIYTDGPIRSCLLGQARIVKSQHCINVGFSFYGNKHLDYEMTTTNMIEGTPLSIEELSKEISEAEFFTDKGKLYSKVGGTIKNIISGIDFNIDNNYISYSDSNKNSKLIYAEPVNSRHIGNNYSQRPKSGCIAGYIYQDSLEGVLFHNGELFVDTLGCVHPYNIHVNQNGETSKRPNFEEIKQQIDWDQTKGSMWYNANYIGYRYFDTTLNKPIYWTGTKWVDATGADV